MNDIISTLPKSLKEIKLKDGRPAYIFLPYNKRFPTKESIKGKEICPYCGKELQQGQCHCYSFKRVVEFNSKLEKNT